MDSFYFEGIISFLEILVLALIFSSIVMFATEFTKSIFKKFNISSWVFVVISLIISAVVCMGLVKTFMDGILSEGDGIWLTFLTWLGSNGMFRYLENNNTFLGKLVKSFSAYYLEEIEKQAGIVSGSSDDDAGSGNGEADSDDEVNDGNDNDETDEDVPDMNEGEDIGNDADINEDDNDVDEVSDPAKEGIDENKDYVLERNENEYPTDTSDIFVNDNEDGNEPDDDAEDNDSVQYSPDDIEKNEIVDDAGEEETNVIKTPEDKMIELIMSEVMPKSDLNDGTSEPNEEILSQFSVTCDDDIINENAPVQKGDLVFNPTTQTEAMENKDLRYE